MRPLVETADGDTHECVDCGARIVSPGARVCEGCGGELQNISRSRDL